MRSEFSATRGRRRDGLPLPAPATGDRPSRPWLPATAAMLTVALAMAPAPARAQAPSGAGSVPPETALAVSTQGSGTPVVVVTGVLGSAYGFRKVIPPLVAAGFRVTVVDPLGFGASPSPDGADYSSAAQALRVARVIEQRGGGPVILACHALAGPICLRLGYLRPDLVRGIVSINGGASDHAGLDEMHFALKVARIVVALAGRGFAIHRVKAGLISSSGDPSWVTDSVVAHYVAPFGSDVGRVVRTLQQIAGAHEPEPLEPNLPRVKAPVLLLFGPDAHGRDRGLNAEELATLRAGLPHFQQENVPGAGMYIQEEQPQRVVAAIEKMREMTR